MMHAEFILPANYRAADVLAFHRRDAEEIAERVGESSLSKGLVFDGAPACLKIDFQQQRAVACLDVDGHADQAAFEAMVQRMLGLGQPVDEFEARFQQHGQIAALLQRQAGLRVPQTASPFEALLWAITGQQISVGAAVAIRRRLIQLANIRHSSGLWCAPEAAQLVGLSEQSLRDAGFSLAKAQTVARVVQGVQQQVLPLDGWLERLPVDEMRAALESVRGIGPWTVNYTLLRGFGWLDGSLHGDVAVRKALQILLGQGDKITEQEAKQWLGQFAPFRALLGAHLWCSLSKVA